MGTNIPFTQTPMDTLSMTPAPAPVSRSHTKLIAVVAVFIAAAAFYAWTLMPRTHEVELDGIPIPFLDGQSADVQGSVLLGKKNGIDIYKVSFETTDNDTLQTDKLYLVKTTAYPPFGGNITTTAFDNAMRKITDNSAGVDYYLYKYSDGNGSYETTNKTAPSFLTRYQAAGFGASARARQLEASHGNAITAFETAKGMTFKPTDGSPGGITLEQNAMYAVIVNETGGARMSIHPTLSICGDGQVTSGETCDDGNFNSSDGCSSSCQTESGYACQMPATPCTRLCGNGTINGTEQCDDGNTIDNDDCSNTCTLNVVTPFTE